MFRFMDRNQDGSLDAGELERFQGPMRDAMERAGVDFRRGVSQAQFTEVMPRAMEQMRGQFGGPPGGRDERSGRDERRGSDRDRSREATPAPAAPAAPAPPPKKAIVRTPKPPVTIALAPTYGDWDSNADGQISFSEWRLRTQGSITQFDELDSNHDGFLTPRELQGSGTNVTLTATGTPTAPPGMPAVGAVAVQNGTPATGTTAASPASGSGGAASTSSNSAGVDARTRSAFQSLDVNRDGQIDADEWKRSRSLRPLFEKIGFDLTNPVKLEAFAEGYARALKS
jgi:Ca2+-binding EF-hand superfamily protein